MIDLAVAIIKARGEGVKRGDRPSEPIELIVRRSDGELMNNKVGGVAVHIGTRVASQAQPGEVLVSSTVKDLVAGSGIVFDHRGVVTLKGIPDEWRLYAVAEVPA